MGKKLEYIVKGAMAQCNQSKAPMIAQLQLIADNLFINTNGNPTATTMTLGPVFGPVPFGICNMIPPTPAVPTPPCVCAIISWSGAYDAIKYNHISSPLTEDSKGSCALGGSISFKMSGQFPKPSVPATPNPATPDMNPTAIDMKQAKLNDAEMRVLKRKAIKTANEGGVIFSELFSGDVQNLVALCQLLNDNHVLYSVKFTSDNKPVITVLGGIDDKGVHMGDASNMSASRSDRKPTTGNFEETPDGLVWHPDPNEKPGGYNPSQEKTKDKKSKKEKSTDDKGKTGDGMAWGESKQKNCIVGEVEGLINAHNARNNQPEDFKFTGIPYYPDGNPDLRQFSVGTIKTDYYTSDRDVNFKMADELMAEQLNDRYRANNNGKDPDPLYTARRVQNWREDPEHKMTWHEDPDCQTIMKVPTILHGNLPHNGGVNAMKKTGIDVETGTITMNTGRNVGKANR